MQLAVVEASIEALASRAISAQHATHDDAQVSKEQPNGFPIASVSLHIVLIVIWAGPPAVTWRGVVASPRLGKMLTAAWQPPALQPRLV